MPQAFRELLYAVRARCVVVSYNDEAWVRPDQITAWLQEAGHEQVRLMAFDSRRYVGAQIGVFDPSGRRVGEAGRLRNVEYVFVAGAGDMIDRAVAAATDVTSHARK